MWVLEYVYFIIEKCNTRYNINNNGYEYILKITQTRILCNIFG